MSRMAEYAESFDVLNDKIQELEAENAELKRVVQGLHGVAGNLAQVLELRNRDGVAKLAEQMKAHGLIA